MKKIIHALFIFSLYFTAMFATDINLDKDFLQKSALSQQHISKAQWDGTSSFPSIVSQGPVGTCQAFGTIAMMEYIFFHETGHVIKFSEKKMIYDTMQKIIQDFWDEKTESFILPPYLGLASKSSMINTITTKGLLPATNYPYGDLREDASKQIDYIKFKNSFVSHPPLLASPEEYQSALDESFFSPPPQALYYSHNVFDFATGMNCTRVFRKPIDFINSLNIRSDRFEILLNNDCSPIYNPIQEEELNEFFEREMQDAKDHEIRSSRVAGNELQKRIVDSLNRHMVVGLAVDVWAGDWLQANVYKGGGGHSCLIVGYQQKDDESEIYFKIRNSWGENIGIDGYNYIPASTLIPNVFRITLYN